MIVASLAIDRTHEATLPAAELALIAGAGHLRRAEFATGRVLLRRVLNTTQPIGRAANGAPSWPTGVVGSLAHDRRRAVAAVAAAGQYRAIGIDVEPHGDQPDDELRLAVLRADDPPCDPTAAFVMKEAAYKAWSSLGGELIDPLAIRLEVRGAAFTAALPRGARVSGVLVDTGDAWLALAVVARVARASGCEDDLLEVALGLSGEQTE